MKIISHDTVAGLMPWGNVWVSVIEFSLWIPAALYPHVSQCPLVGNLDAEGALIYANRFHSANRTAWQSSKCTHFAAQAQPVWAN